MKLYKIPKGNIVYIDNRAYKLPNTDWDSLLNNDNIVQELPRFFSDSNQISITEGELNAIALPPFKVKKFGRLGSPITVVKRRVWKSLKKVAGVAFTIKYTRQSALNFFLKVQPKGFAVLGKTYEFEKTVNGPFRNPN